MSLDSQDLEIISLEEDIVSTTISNLKAQKQKYWERQEQQNKLARELNSEIVNTIRAEEKVQIYSSEAVAYGLVEMSRDSIEIINQQLDSPYFARLELAEELPNGNVKKIEYKIGKNANSDCRVIDWRKAPIAKLYYDYNEGDSYYEIIQGQERQGEIKLKNSFEIQNAELIKIITNNKKLFKNNNKWQKHSKNNAPRSSYNKLPDILAFITSEQFKSITNDPELPVIIQGVAGSGKTIVALHRLSWLLHDNNSNLSASEVIFTVKSLTLLQYIKNSLLEAKLETVTLKPFNELIIILLNKLSIKIEIRKEIIPSSIRRLLYSYALDKAIKQSDFKTTDLRQSFNIILNVLQSDSIINLDSTKLISKDLISSAYHRLKQQINENCYDLEFVIISLKIWQSSSPETFKGLFKHLIIDEIQDFTRIELDFLLNCLENKQQVTLLGDINQDLNTEIGFPGWDFLKEKIGISNLIQLKISHRSTLPIINVAQKIINQELSKDGRIGKQPIWFGCKNEETAVKACIKWLKMAQDKFPLSLTAVICVDIKEAKYLYKLLEPSFNNSLRLLDKDLNLSEGIVIADISQTKGLEFYNVVIWNVSQENYPDQEFNQRQLYISTTRAEENLSFISWGKASEILRKIPENFIRRYKYEG